MEFLKTIFPLFGVIIGWVLSESGKLFADKRQDKRKLKKLLFFLLELRYHFAKELSIETNIDKFIELIKDKLVNKFEVDTNDPEFANGLDFLKPILEKTILNVDSKDNKFEYLSENIDKIIIELAEIFPVLAYELSGQHNIKERLNRAKSYFDEIKSVTTEFPFDIMKWVNPKLTNELVHDLDLSIEKIAIKIDKQILSEVKIKIAKMTFEHEEKELNVVLDEYFEKVIQTISNQ